jgi:hypothetical protein
LQKVKSEDFSIEKVYVFLIYALLTIIISSTLVYFLRYSTGESNIEGVGVEVFWDANCDNPIHNLSWGTINVDPLQPQISKNTTIYLKNRLQKPITLQLNTSNWLPPEIHRYINITWDYTGKPLKSYEIVKITLTLSIDKSIWFENLRLIHHSFKIIISANDPQNSR